MFCMTTLKSKWKAVTFIKIAQVLKHTNKNTQIRVDSLKVKFKNKITERCKSTQAHRQNSLICYKYTVFFLAS